MNSIDHEYYVIVTENNLKHPMLSWGDSNKPPLKKVTDDQPLHLEIAEPIPDEYEIADYHVLPRPVISEKIKHSIDKCNLFNVQFIPASIKTTETKFDNYYLFHIYNLIKCLDIKNSDVTIDEDLDDIEDLRSFSLDEKKLFDIDLKDRLVFILWEYPSIYICHKSIKNKIESTHSIGIRFIPIKEWSDDINFR